MPGVPLPASCQGDGAPTEDAWCSLDPGWLAVQRLVWWISGLLLVSGGALALALTLVRGTTGRLVLAGLALLALPLGVLLGMAWTRCQYRRARWRVTVASLEIRRGVVWRRWLQVPRSRVQHTDVVQGPLQRRHGVATLLVHTAGTGHATVTLDGLRREQAEAVRDLLLEGAGDDL